jgi:putative glutamine amidotransferase
LSRATPARPLVGINTDYVNAGRTAPASIRLHAGYFDAVLAAGGLPVLLPPIKADAEIDALLDRLDGIVLTGGLDMDPKRQGLPSHPAVQPMAARREESDRLLVKRVVERRVPVLGIGLGMQQINLACGGTLHLHIPDELPRAMPHYDPTGGPHRHIVLLEPKTKMDAIYGGGELRVNSAHHQAVKTLGQKLRVGARSPDEVVEAVESTDPRWFCIGVQWHPEADTASALDMQLFESFVEACSKARAALELVA